MDTNTVAQHADWRKAQYADGVFIRLTGGTVHDSQPWGKINGFLDAATMTADEAANWLTYCVNTLGYILSPNGPATPANIQRQQRNDELMRQHHAEYMDWLAEIETFEDPDDNTIPDDEPIPAWTVQELFQDEHDTESAAIRAELFSF